MTVFKNGQRVTHESVRGVMTVNSPAAIGGRRTYSNNKFSVAPRKGYTNCTYKVDGRTYNSDFLTSELKPVADLRTYSSAEQAQMLLEEAVLKLMAEGLDRGIAIKRVGDNFIRLNNSNLIVTLEALCSRNPFDPDWKDTTNEKY